MIQHVPDMFRPRIRVEYPPDNKQIFEEWFFDNVRPEDIPGDRVYLPVFFCSFQVNNDYGKGRKMADLQAFIDGLDRSNKYFTITQYDDGPLFDFKDLDIKVFGSGGGRIDCAIPLVCMPHKYNVPYIQSSKRKYLASFVGSITHPIRQKMIDVINELPSLQRERYYIETNPVSIDHFCHIMAQSTFALCPRGYGKTSFRICEALQYGAIPLYISDDFIDPFPHYMSGDEHGIIALHEDWIHDIHSSLTSLSNPDMWQIEGGIFYDKFFKYDSLKNEILEWLKHLS